MDRVFKSKVGWWYHLILLVMAASTVAAFVGGKSPVTMIVLLLFTLECIHMLLSTWYKITADHLQRRHAVAIDFAGQQAGLRQAVEEA